MKYYLAPMEGITGYIYRNSYEHFFHNIDKYFTPFIIPNQSKKFKTKELNDILPENNKCTKIVPQILTNNAEDFISTTSRISEYGYNEVNLNLGCPSRTVVSKNRGSGFLAKTEELDIFLDKIFSINDVKISIKTRIGKEEPEEFYRLIEIYNKYPLEELIIHPRIQRDFYKNKPNLEVFKDALNLSKNPICYNGDIFTSKDYKELTNKFPEVNTIMLGRGVIANPGLINEIINETLLNKNMLKNFHDEILNGYIESYSGDANVLFKMKELWGYMIYIFSNNRKYSKSIKKSQNLIDYVEVVTSLFKEQEIIKGAGLFSNDLNI